ncbi:hypothetical protein E6H37_05925 [Candidatus Bathyarchaeota archaeon]|nr:MAG: hypothetical protein E6H37_05925 [Candidatus Bathyarchaeota archaeon]
MRTLKSSGSRFPDMTTAVNLSLDQSLIESIDAALSALGTSTRDSILTNLRKKYSMSLQDIPQRMDEFLQALNRLLGYGARVIEKLVIARLVETHEISLSEARGRSLAEVVYLANMNRTTDDRQLVNSS